MEHGRGEPFDARESAVLATMGLSPELFQRLAPYLLESVAVVSAEGTVRAVLGPPGGALGLSEVVGRHIFEYCLEEDVPRAVELAVEALNSSPGWSTNWVTRLVRADGRAADFEVHIENHQDDPLIEGFILRLRELPGTSVTDTPLFASELGVELESLAGAVPLPILFVGSDANLYYLNDAARDFCGELAATARRDGLGALAAPGDRPALESAIAELLSAPGERVVRFATDEPDAARPRIVEARLSGLGQGHRVLALIATLVDVTERAAEESELRRLAASDPLTGLPNRTELLSVLERRLGRDPERVTLLYVDLDGFKLVNDTHGHDSGDEFLIRVSNILAGSVRAGDFVARIGGDEFTLVLDGGARGAEALARRIEGEIAAYADSVHCAVSASVGVASGRRGDDPRDLLRRADSSMYSIKRERRATS